MHLPLRLALHLTSDNDCCKNDAHCTSLISLSRSVPKAPEILERPAVEDATRVVADVRRKLVLELRLLLQPLEEAVLQPDAQQAVRHSRTSLISLCLQQNRSPKSQPDIFYNNANSVPLHLLILH